MLGLDHHGNTQGTGDLRDGIGDLAAEVFLDLQAAGIHVDDTRDLGQAQHFTVGNIGNVRLADERQQMVFAQRIQFDVPHQDHFTVIGAEQGTIGDLFQGLFITAAKVLHGFGGALWRVAQAFAGYILAKLAENRGVVLFQGHGPTCRVFIANALGYGGCDGAASTNAIRHAPRAWFA
ncbi:hypothetical protein D3C85_1099420 [compost metagenome]